MNSDLNSPDRWLSFGLAFVGGFGDAAGFVLAKTFTGHITGSLVLGAITIAAHDRRGALEHFTATACFLTGIPLSVLIARWTATRSSWALLPITMGIEVILIVAAYLALVSRLASGTEIFVVCLALALGMQNGAFRRSEGISVHTTYLTGLITGLLTTEAEKYAHYVAPRSSTAPNSKAGILYGIWCTFVLGAGTGAAAVFHFGERGILLSAFILLAIIARSLATTSRAYSANGGSGSRALF